MIAVHFCTATATPSLAYVITVGLSLPVNCCNLLTSRAVLMIGPSASWASSPCLLVSSLYCSMYILKAADNGQYSMEHVGSKEMRLTRRPPEQPHALRWHLKDTEVCFPEINKIGVVHMGILGFSSTVPAPQDWHDTICSTMITCDRSNLGLSISL